MNEPSKGQNSLPFPSLEKMIEATGYDRKTAERIWANWTRVDDDSDLEKFQLKQKKAYDAEHERRGQAFDENSKDELKKLQKEQLERERRMGSISEDEYNARLQLIELTA